MAFRATIGVSWDPSTKRKVIIAGTARSTPPSAAESEGESMQKNRRNVLRTAVAAMAGAGAAQAQTGPVKKVHYKGEKPKKTPLFSSAVSYGNLLFIAGKGAHVPGDIKSHTDIVLDDLEAELKNAGSSMEKVLNVSVFLNDIKDWE